MDDTLNPYLSPQPQGAFVGPQPPAPAAPMAPNPMLPDANPMLPATPVGLAQQDPNSWQTKTHQNNLWEQQSPQAQQAARSTVGAMLGAWGKSMQTPAPTAANGHPAAAPLMQQPTYQQGAFQPFRLNNG